MAIEVDAQKVIEQLLAQNKQLVAEIAVLRVLLGFETVGEEDSEDTTS